MAPPLRLTLTDYLDTTRWRWVLSDSRGTFLADHTVQLDPTSREYGGLLDLHAYLDFHKPISTYKAQLDALGMWIGDKVFGGLRDALWKKRAKPAVAVQVILPEVAQDLLARPFELARFADGTSFVDAGIRFVYQIEGTPAQMDAKEPMEHALRILAAFSLPVRANPLNLRRERYGLQRLVRQLTQTNGVAIDLRVLQYGATRATLQDALEEGAGWDIIHLSGHGNQGELLLADDQGGTDDINAQELGDLLEPGRARLKLLILDACYSGAGSHAAARAQVGLDRETTRQDGAEGVAVAETAQTTLPSLAQALSQHLDCATLAMRYPVGDAFATELMLALYDKLLDKRRPLPAALHLALDDTLKADIPQPPLSAATPILVGARRRPAADAADRATAGL